MPMKTKYAVILMMAQFALLVTGMSPYAATTDDRIKFSIQKSYAFKTYLSGDDIKIQSRDGAVTLEGTVADELHKSLAYETVTGIPGVKNVHNMLALKEASPTTNSDAWISAQTKGTLLFHRSVSAGKTEIIVKDGIVTLRGMAASESQKELTTAYARDVEGVKDVKNEMTVLMLLKTTKTPPNESIDDASITAQVRMALLSHRSTSAINSRVESKKGLVTLSGKAKNAAEIKLVSRLVNDITGVKKVRNKMTIESAK